MKETVYKVVIMGRMLRLFVSIPTKHPKVNRYYNVHYLLNAGSPITTLTRKALCAIHEKEYNSDESIIKNFLWICLIKLEVKRSKYNARILINNLNFTLFIMPIYWG